MTKRTAQETWDALDEAALDAEIDRVIAMTPEEREQELSKAGFDVDKVHAESDAFYEKLQAMRPELAADPPAPAPAQAANVLPLPSQPAKRPRRALVVGVGVGAALALAASIAVIIQMSTPGPPVGGPDPPVTPAQRAETLRHSAGESCQHEHWQTCLDSLDEAREADPQGDVAPEVQALRKLATEKLGHP
jgi:hypothetical protein